MYSPKLGRFISPDTIIQAPENSQSLNCYSYVFNNSLSYTEPTGHVAEGLNSQGHDEFTGVVDSFYANNNTATLMSGGWGFLGASSVVSDSPKSEEFEGKDNMGNDDNDYGSMGAKGSIDVGVAQIWYGDEWSVKGGAGYVEASVEYDRVTLGLVGDAKITKVAGKLEFKDWRISGVVSLSASTKIKKLPLGDKVLKAFPADRVSTKSALQRWSRHRYVRCIGLDVQSNYDNSYGQEAI